MIHKPKNSRTARKKKFQFPRMNLEKVSTRLEDIKVEGLKQILKQIEVPIDIKKKIIKKKLVGMIDPIIRSIEKNTYLVVGEKRLRRYGIVLHSGNLPNEINEICLKEHRAHYVAFEIIVTGDDLYVTAERCVYLDRKLV